MSASDFSAGIAVVSGSPGAFVLEACGPGTIGFFAGAGVPYKIIAFDDQLDGTGTGGMLSISIDEAPPSPVVELTVDPVGHFNSQSGSATITGTVTCTGEIEFRELDVDLRQRVGRVVISGFGFGDFPCDGTTHEWSVEVVGQNGLFKGGRRRDGRIRVRRVRLRHGVRRVHRPAQEVASHRTGDGRHGRPRSAEWLHEHVAELDLPIAVGFIEPMRPGPLGA